MLHKLKSIIKKNASIYHFLIDAINQYSNWKDKRNEPITETALERLSYLPKKEKIRVGFLCQIASCWDKEQKIYDEMCLRDNIETLILAVPPYDFVNKKYGVEYAEAGKSNYFLDTYPDAIKTINPDGSVIDITALQLDYIFYQRPYDIYLPRGLKSQDLVKIAKLCYLPYGIILSPAYFYISQIHPFFRNMFFVFSDIEETDRYLKEKYKAHIAKGYQHIEYLGYPEYEDYLDVSKSFEKNILWTPRWTYDEAIGGSHFSEYKDQFTEFKKSHPEIHLTIRPHPLMFDNFIRQNLMSRQEVADYKQALKEVGIHLSENTPLKEDLLWADILVSDFSSILAMYYSTGKPIIYCESTYPLTEEMQTAFKGTYSGNNWSEINTSLQLLLAGNDPHLPYRNDFIKNHLAWHKNSSKRIVDCIAEDGILKNSLNDNSSKP